MIENLQGFRGNDYDRLAENKLPSPSHELRIVPIAFPPQKS